MTTLWVGTRKGLFEYTRVHGHWDIARVHFLAEPVTMMLRDPRNDALYAALNLGHFGVKLWRSRDRGQSWHELPAPKFPEKPSDSDDKTPWSVALLWCLETGGPDQPGWLWAGTVPGGLFLSRDQGESWTLVESLWQRPERLQWVGGGYDHPGIHSICVDPRDARRVSVGVSCGGVWVSTDAGNEWQCKAQGMRADYMPPERAYDPVIQDPHRLAQCHAHPDTLWAQHHNGIFLTRDGCEHWQEIQGVDPSAFGFAVAVHPRDADRAWFVPAIKDERRVPVAGKLVVTRTRDGGRSFESFGEGLPQTHAYHLIYRHGLAIDDAGQRLAMGSTTGSLWISEHQGERWQRLSAELPPINCVRWS